jgi:hypothetical protein
MTVKELIERLKKCRADSEAIIVEIDDSWIEINHIKGVAVADTGEALISIGGRGAANENKRKRFRNNR